MIMSEQEMNIEAAAPSKAEIIAKFLFYGFLIFTAVAIVGYFVSIIPYSSLLPGFVDWFESSVLGTYNDWTSRLTNPFALFFAFLIFWIVQPIFLLGLALFCLSVLIALVYSMFTGKDVL